MEAGAIRIILVEDNPGDVRLVKQALADANTIRFELVHVERLDEAINRLHSGRYDVVLLDLSLPDSHGIDTFIRLYEHTLQDVPVIVMTGNSDDSMAVRAVQAGAQDYLVKGQVDSHLIVRAIRYAIERYRMQAALRSLSLIDDLTRLYNRRGFITLAEQHIKLANRTNNGLLLVFADLDDMKLINDTCGHQQGDRALVDTAEILKVTFRESDIIARMGGDEFAIVAVEANPDSTALLVKRLHQQLDLYNSRPDALYKLSISLGIVHYEPGQSCSLDELLSQADTLMYEEKRRRKQLVAD